jgi:hypothetical protein
MKTNRLTSGLIVEAVSRMTGWGSVAAAVAIIVALGILFSKPSPAQLLSPAKRAEHVKIIQGPMLEMALDGQAIV